MKHSAKQWFGIGILVAGTLAVALGAEEGRKAGKQGRQGGRDGWMGDEKVKQFHEQMAKERKAFFETQIDKHKTFMDTLKDKPAKDACLAIIDQRTAQQAEAVKFTDGQQAKRVEFMTAHMAEKGVPQAEQDKRLAKLNETHATMKAAQEQRFQKQIQTLTQLSHKEDLTWDELRAALKDMRPLRGEGRGPHGKGKAGNDGAPKGADEQPAPDAI